MGYQLNPYLCPLLRKKNMKKFLLPVLAITALFSLNSCSEKFKVAAPYKSITVVYGLIDQADTAHYIRIEKAFLDENKSAVTMAQNPDSNFFPTLDVIVRKVDPNTGVVAQNITLTRVDLNVEGYPKQPGDFFTGPSYAYKFKNTLDASYNYRLVITNPATGEVDSAETPIINDVDRSVFNLYYLDDTIGKRDGIDFSSTLESVTLDITGNYNTTLPTSPVQFLQGTLTFNWLDSNNLPPHVETPHSADFSLGTVTNKSNAFDFSPTDLSLYFAIRSSMGAAPVGISRILAPFTLTVYAGTPDLYTYQQISLTQGTGLTGNEIEPTYTNMKGKNVLGIFTSRGYRKGNVILSLQTVDTLMTSQYTTDCRIVGSTFY